MENMEERQVEVKRYEKYRRNPKLNSEKIWKI
jgi:hypothetical protein